MGAVESKTAVKSKAIQRGPERCCETKGYVEGLVESILGLEPKVMLESKATSQLGAIAKGSVQEQKQSSRAIVKSNRQSGAEAIVRCDRQEQSSERSRSNRQV